MSNPLRTYCVDKLTDLSQDRVSEKTILNLEKAIFNWCVKHVKGTTIIPSWENPKFKQVYMRKIHSILFNFRKPESMLWERLCSGEISSRRIPEMAPDELWPGGPWDLTQKELRIQAMKKDLANDRLTDYSGTFKCPKCKSDKTTYYQLQTRSADEPMTTFCTCLTCGKRWKFC